MEHMNIKQMLAIAWLLLVGPAALAKLNVFTCEPEWQSLVDSLGGEQVSSFSATSAFQDPHHIEARPSLIARLRQADLLVCTGSELEIGWLPVLLQKSANGKVQANRPGHFMAADYIETLDKQTYVDRSMGDVHASGNPHVHLDPYRLLSIAKKLSQRLRLLDANNADFYKQRFEDFEQQWISAMIKWEDQAKPLKEMPVVVQHANWRYLFAWLGIKAVADLEPKPGLPPSSGHLVEVLATLKREPARLLVLAAYQNRKAADWLVEREAMPVVVLPFTIGGHPQATDLFSLYALTIEQLLEARSQGKAGS
jgi:zinc/manganese transport system substrate-binding protein